MSKKLIIVLVVLTIIVFGAYFLINMGVLKKKPEVSLVLKTPVLQMVSTQDPEINDSYTFAKKIAKAFEEQYKDAKVTIKVVQFAKEDENKQILDAFNTANATDILFEEYMNMSTYIHTGNVVPLDDIITDEIRNDINDSYWDVSKLNGKTYMMPYFGMQNTLCYNKDLFKQVGLEKYISNEDVIQNWTLSDFETILSTLHQKLPENMQTMMMYAKNEMGDTHVITLLRSHGSTFFDENGRVNLSTPEGIAAVKWLMDCNEKGYFPTNAENLEINDCYDLFRNGQLGIYICNPVLETSIKASGINYGQVNFPSIRGNGFNTTFLTGFEVFDNGDKTKLKVAKDFIKFIYENEEMLGYSAGSIPSSNKIAVKYAEELKSIQKYIDNGQYGWNYTGNAPSWRKVREVFYKDIKELLYGEKTAEEIAELIETDCNKAIEDGYKNSKLHE